MPRPYHRGRQIANVTDDVTPKERAFAAAYLTHLDVERAKDAAGLPATSRPLNRPSVQRLIAGLQAERMKRCEITHDDVLRRWDLLAGASMNELVELWRVPCIHCHGEDHRMQRTPHAMRRAQLRHLEQQLRLPTSERREFDEEGGDGYDLRKPVYSVENGYDHNCPECHGLGETFAYFKDTRYLTPAGQILYDGVKIGKDGSVEMKARSRTHAEEMVSRHVGLMKDTPRPPRRIDEMTDEELDEEIMASAARLVEGEGLPLLAAPEPALSNG